MKAKKAFTVVELLVVMAIIAVLASIAFTFGDRLGEGERVVQCQAQLRAIYQAIRMYKLDAGGVPLFDPSEYLGLVQKAQGGDAAARKRISEYGLNAFYVLGYIDNRRAFKCPDNTSDSRSFSSVEEYWAAMNGYQDPRNEDGLFPPPNSINDWPYLTDLGITDPSDPRYYRQLQPRGEEPRRWWPADDTVVTWCRFHRGLYRRGGKDLDIVLFWDGSVKVVFAPAGHFTKPSGGGRP